MEESESDGVGRVMVLTCEEREDGEICEEVMYWRTAVESSDVTGVLSSLCSDFRRLRACLRNSSGWREEKKEGRREEKREQRNRPPPLFTHHPLPSSLLPPGTKDCSDSPKPSETEHVSVEQPRQRNNFSAHSNSHSDHGA